MILYGTLSLSLIRGSDLSFSSSLTVMLQRSSITVDDWVEWAALFAIACGVTIVNDRLVTMQLSGKAPKRARAALLLVFFFWTIFVIGWHYGFQGLWLVGSAAYL